jgi:small multidrug resistance pump
MAWVLLFFSIVFEVLGTTCMKLSDGLTKLVPSILVFVFYFICFTLLTLALKKIDLGIAYAIWAGSGTAIIALIAFFWFGEPITLLKVISIGLVVAGVVGLNLAGGAH